jgi:hypothetical protein
MWLTALPLLLINSYNDKKKGKVISISEAFFGRTIFLSFLPAKGIAEININNN